MARGSAVAAAAVAVVVGVLMGGASAVFPYGYYGTPSVVYHPPTYYNAPPISQPVIYTSAPMRPISMRAEEVVVLPCPKAGFYVHPTNSSRFYRCVDHTGTGQFFVRYMFECLAGYIFVPDPGFETCMPGDSIVIGSPQPPVASSPTPMPATDPPVPSTSPPVPPVPVTDPPVPVTQPPVPMTEPTVPSIPPVPLTEPTVPSIPPVPSTQPPVPSSDPPVPAVTDVPAPPTESPAPPTPDDGCMGQYIQHELHCNVYRRCNDTSKRYMCPQGTVFNEQRQMCRLGAADEVLCQGKTVAAMASQSQSRAELVDGHFLLPDDAVLVPLFAFPHTQSHVVPTLSLRTPNVPHPYNEPSPGSNIHSSPYSTVVKSQSLSLVRPRPLISPYSAAGYGSQPVSVNNVRNPQNHLHFPSFPYTHRDSDLGYALPYYRDASVSDGNPHVEYRGPPVVPGNPNFEYRPLFP